MSTPQDRLASLGAFVERECPQVAFAYLFGSVARGQTTPRSDVDIAIDAAEADVPADPRIVLRVLTSDIDDVRRFRDAVVRTL